MFSTAMDFVEEYAGCYAYVEAFYAVFEWDANHLFIFFDLAWAVAFVANNERDFFRQGFKGFIVINTIGICHYKLEAVFFEHVYDFFNIFNHLHQNRKQLILTSDRAPKDLVNFEERLQSRMKWGLSVELNHPDYNTRLDMLRSRCNQEGLVISDDVLQYIAMHVKKSFRELQGALISLMAYSTFTHRDASIEMAEGIVSKIVGEEKSELSISKVQHTVCEYFKISREDLVSTSRKRKIVQARQISMYLCRNLIDGCSLAAIGAQCGGKDHSTVLHSCSIVGDLMTTDKVFRKYVTDIQGMLAPVSK